MPRSEHEFRRERRTVRIAVLRGGSKKNLSGTQLVEQRLCFLEVGRVEALGESGIDGREEIGSLLSFAALGQQRGEVARSAQLQATAPPAAARSQVRGEGPPRRHRAHSRQPRSRQRRAHAMEFGGESQVAA